jgi:hypothetical protein
MNTITISVPRPATTEYGEYYGRYIQRVPDEDVFGLMARQYLTLSELLGGLSPEKADFRPGPKEWSIKEVVGHINDTERVFAYRALCISRSDLKPLPGFNQDDYVRESAFSARTLADVLEEFDLLRQGNILQFNRLTPEMLLRQGTASDMPVSVRALLYMMAGHVEHHIESLKVDYLPKLKG